MRGEVTKIEKSLNGVKDRMYKEWLNKEFSEKTNNLSRNLVAIMDIPKEKRTKKQEDELQKGIREHYFKRIFPRRFPNTAEAKELEQAKRRAVDYEVEYVPRVMVMRDDKPRETSILERGDYTKPRANEKVESSTPGFLLPLPADAPKNRLGFAKWLFLPDHPLTARVQINRMWQVFLALGL